MPMVRTAVKAFAVLLLALMTVLAGAGLATAEGSDTPAEVQRRIEALRWPTLTRGTVHWRVFVVKKLLGVPTSQNENVYDAALHNAVTAYQVRKDLSERNQVGTETWENLRYDFGQAGPGTSGPKVFAVQISLWGNGYLNRGDIDGLYGPVTQRAVREFQADVGINADGIVGRFTFRALICKGT